MTYCVALRLDTGMIFASDSRTNAGVDHIATFTKMRVYEKKDDRVIVVLSSGNLAMTQGVINLLDRHHKAILYRDLSGQTDQGVFEREDRQLACQLSQL